MAESKQAANSYEFLLKVIAVKMKIKFPCRMTLQFNKQVITKQVPSGDSSKFVFNEDIVLRGQDGNAFQILAHLYTDKGTKYTSGVFKLLAAELLRSQGQRLVVPLNKCLDPDAFCEIKVDQVINVSKTISKVSRTSSKLINSAEKQDLLSPEVKKINSEKYMIGETRSEVNFGLAGGIFQPGSEENRVRQTTKTQILKTFTKSPNNKFSNIKYVTMNTGNVMKNLSQFPVEQVGSQRPSFAETQVYREGYYKLKQKFKKQSEIAKEESHKRMLLEANQNNFKLQIMKLKLKGEEQEKQINDKNQKIKAINSQLIDLQKKDIDISYLKEENANLERKLKISQENTHTLQQDIESIKKVMTDRLKLSEEGLSAVRHQLEFAKAKIQEQKYEFESQIKAKDNVLLGKNNDLKMRADTIQRQKKVIKDLQEQAEARIFEFQKSLTAERAAMQSKIDEIKTKKAVIEIQKEQSKRKITELLQQIEKHKNTISLLQYNKKMLSEENILLNQSIEELKIVKEKHGQLQKEYKFLEEQFQTVRRNLQMAVQNKQINITELSAKFDEGRERQEKIKAQSEQRIKSLLVKTQQLELSLDTSKSALQKNKRSIQSLTKENSALREQNHLLREEIKTVEKRIINLEGEYTTNYSKYDRQNANFKFILEKYKDDKNALQKENDSLKEKLEKSDEKIKNFQDNERQWKVKERHLEERLEKEQAKLKENQQKYEASLKQNQQTIIQLNANIELLQKEAKKNVKKINQNQFAAIKTKETHQLLKKSIKLNEEKIYSLQTQIKAKNQQLNDYSQKLKLKQFKIHQYDHEVSKLKQEIVQHSNKQSKQQKIIQLLNSEVDKLKKSASQLQNIIINKQANEERLREQIKSTRDQHAKQKIRGNKIQGQFDKFRDSINDIIQIEFTRILNVPNSPNSTQRNTERLRQSQVSNARSQKSKVKAVVDSGQLVNTLAQKLHQTKNGLWRMVELNKALKIQNQKLMEQSQSQSNKHQFNKLQLHRDIQLLEDQMNNIINDKEVQCINYDNMLIELNNRLKEKDMAIEELKGENQQLSAINTGLKTDFQTNNDLNDKKVNTLKANITELNQKIEYLNFNLGCLQDKNHELDEKTIQQETQIVTHKEQLMKFEKSVRDLKESEEKLIKEVQLQKKQYKALNEKFSESEILLNTQRQTKEKYSKMLQEQQKKTEKLNEFISSLIVQKQSAIKNQLQKSQEVNNLQNKVFDLSHQNEVLKDQNQVNKKKIEEFKQEVKNLSKSLKSLEKQLSQEKSRHVRSVQKIKERENDLEIKKSYIKDLQDKYRELRDKNYKQIKELSNQLEDKSAASVTQHKQLNDKILKLQSQSKKVWEENIVLKNELETLTKEIYKKNDQIEDLQIEVKKLRDDRVNLQDQLTSKQFIIHEKVQEIDKLEQLLQSQRVNFNNFSNQYELHQKQFNLNITEITNQYNFKLQSTSKEYQQKLELSKRQCEFIRQKLKNIEEEFVKIQLQKKSQQIDFDQQKKMYQQKMKKIESDRLSTTLAKNNEIKKISEESRGYFEKLKEKEAELRQLNLELQQNRLTSGRTQQVSNHSLQQIKTKEKLLQKQIEGLKKKEENNNNYKKQLLECLYKNEADVRKTIAATVKKITEVCSKSDSEKVLGIIKGLQGGVIRAMMANLQVQ